MYRIKYMMLAIPEGVIRLIPRNENFFCQLPFPTSQSALFLSMLCEVGNFALACRREKIKATALRDLGRTLCLANQRMCSWRAESDTFTVSLDRMLET